MSFLRQSVFGIPVPALMLFLVVANLLLAFPGIDLAVSGLFGSPDLGFPAYGQPWERALYRSVPFLMVTLNLLLVAVWVWNRVTGGRRLGLTGRRLALLLLLLALVPGLLVNQVFKEHWGRARPVQVVEFGGNRAFTPAFLPSDQGGGSFTSGHVAAAAYTIAVAATLAGPRSPWVALAALYTGLVALARIAAGGHYLSDTVLAIFLVLMGFALLKNIEALRDR